MIRHEDIKTRLRKKINLSIKNMDMKVEVIQKVNKEYFKEYYTSWLRFSKRDIRTNIVINFVAVILTIGLIIAAKEFKLYLAVLIALPIINMFSEYQYFLSRKNWIKNQFSDEVEESNLIITFEDNRIQSKGANILMNENWSYFKKAIETEKGVFLIPKRGNSIYLQKDSFENQGDLKEIISKI